MKVLSYKLVRNTEFVRLFGFCSWLWSQPVCNNSLYIKEFWEQICYSKSVSTEKKT